MLVGKILSKTVISVAKGISKVVLGEIFKSIKGDNRGVVIPYRSDGNENIICFVHGFCGNPESTFNPMPEFIINEKELDGWDVLSIGYSTDIMPNIGKGIWASSPDLNKISSYLKTNLDIIFNSYNRVALIGHSMGGLVIQRTILDMEDIHKISHVLFFGTPSAGLNKAWFMKWFKNQIRDMDNEGEFIKNLRGEWNNRFTGEYPFRFATVAGELDEFVPTYSSLDPFPHEYRSFTSGNHITMVKPQKESDTSFQILKNVLQSDRDYLMGFNETELNNLIGKYHEDVNTLRNELSKLSNSGFRKYIFALEGIGKIDEAINAIEESVTLNSNTDLMGILGGRWKRKYLIGNDSNYLDLAIHWYNKGLSISIENDNSAQIYYHAINLALLYLMQNEHDLSKSKQMAQLALENCERCSNGDYWETATKAEAYLYLNNFDESKRLYTEAIQKCHRDIRAMSSMMINAFYACISLNKLDWKHQLEEIFME